MGIGNTGLPEQRAVSAGQALLSITGAPGKIYKGSSFTLQTSGGSGDGA